VLFAYDYPNWLPQDLSLPALVGSACALGLIGAIILVRTLRRKSAPSAPERPFSLHPPEHDPFVAGSASEQRETLRRRGTAVRVLIRGPGAERDPATGYVLDRSSGGLALCTRKEFPNGTFLHVRPDADPEANLWVKLEVRTARREHGEWHLGCKFTETPPWSVLLQFS
jgi:PilZ domain